MSKQERKQGFDYIKIPETISNKNVVKTIKKNINYNKIYGLKGFTGKGVKIAVLDSGVPNHKDIKECSDYNIFCKGYNKDNIGHSTMVSGLMFANNPKAITGVSPNAEMLFAKVTNTKRKCTYDSLVAGILWAITKKVDIISISLGTKTNYNILHNAVKKAEEMGIIIVSSSGNKVNTTEYIDYPAKYPESFSVGCSIKTEMSQEKVDFIFKKENLVTTFLNNQYITMSGSSLYTALVSGSVATILEKLKKDKKNVKNINKQVYVELVKLFKN